MLLVLRLHLALLSFLMTSTIKPWHVAKTTGWRTELNSLFSHCFLDKELASALTWWTGSWPQCPVGRQEVDEHIEEVLMSHPVGHSLPTASSGSVRGAKQCQANNTIDSDPVGEGARIVPLLTDLCLCGFRLWNDIWREIRCVIQTMWFPLLPNMRSIPRQN